MLTEDERKLIKLVANEFFEQMRKELDRLIAAYLDTKEGHAILRKVFKEAKNEKKANTRRKKAEP